jgi:hypothetical protein
MHRLTVEGPNMVVNLKRVKDAFDMEDLPYDPLWDDDDDWAVPDPEEDEKVRKVLGRVADCLVKRNYPPP